jgi:hypothetical protein
MEHYEEEKFPFHIIIIVDRIHYALLEIPLNESWWEPSSERGYCQRVDKAHFDHDRLHVHLAQQKHINAKNKQVSWNDDGTRHDRSTFNVNMVGMERAKRAARNALGLPKDAYLECLSVPYEGELLLESVENLPSNANAYIFKVTDQTFLLS